MVVPKIDPPIGRDFPESHRAIFSDSRRHQPQGGEDHDQRDPNTEKLVRQTSSHQFPFHGARKGSPRW